MKLVGLECVHLLPFQKIYRHWHLLIEEEAMVVAMVPDTDLVDKEIVAVAENGNQTKIEILETETEIEMKIEIELVIYGIVNEQNRMLIDSVMVQSYPMLLMTN